MRDNWYALFDCQLKFQITRFTRGFRLMQMLREFLIRSFLTLSLNINSGGVAFCPLLSLFLHHILNNIESGRVPATF
jgi:hypothetical protein